MGSASLWAYTKDYYVNVLSENGTKDVNLLHIIYIGLLKFTVTADDVGGTSNKDQDGFSTENCHQSRPGSDADPAACGSPNGKAVGGSGRDASSDACVEMRRARLVHSRGAGWRESARLEARVGATRGGAGVADVHSGGAGWRDSARPKARVSATRDGAAEEPWLAFPDAVRVSVDHLLREIHQCALDEKSTLSKCQQ